METKVLSNLVCQCYCSLCLITYYFKINPNNQIWPIKNNKRTNKYILEIIIETS